MHGSEGSLVVGDFGADCRLHGEGGVGVGVVEDHVDPPPALGRGAGEVDVNVPVLDGHRHLDPDRLLEPVAPGLVLVATVGDRLDRPAHRLLGAVHYLPSDRIDGVKIELVHELEERPGAHLVAGGLCVQVAHRLVGSAHVGPDQLDEVLVDLSGAEQFHDGQSQPLLINLSGLGGEDPAPYVGRVAGVGEIADDSPSPEHRGCNRDVVDLPGGHPRVVGEKNIAFGEPFGRVFGQQVAHPGRHGVDVARSAGERLGHHGALGVEHPAGQVLRLPDDGAERGSHQGHLLFVHHRKEPVPQHLQEDGVHPAHSPTSVPPSVTTRFS